MYNIRFLLVALTTVLLLNNLNAQTPIKRRPDANSKPSGGIIEKPYRGNTFLFINAQSTVPSNKVASQVQKIRWATIMPFETKNDTIITNTGSAKQVAKEITNNKNVGAGVVIVDIAEDTGFINYEEGNWAVLNIAFLQTDNPSLEKLEQRVAKLLWIAAGRVLGAGYSNKMGTVLKPFRTLKELDANTATRPDPEGFNAMLENGERFGIKTITISSYRTAVRNGWAPAPTNDIQKAIWDEIKGSK